MRVTYYIGQKLSARRLAQNTSPYTHNRPLSRTAQVSWYQKRHSPTHTHQEEEAFAQTTRSIACELNPIMVLSASETC